LLILVIAEFNGVTILAVVRYICHLIIVLIFGDDYDYDDDDNK